MGDLTLTDDAEGVRAYLSLNVEARNRFGMDRPKGWHYGSMEEFVLAHGTAYAKPSRIAWRYRQKTIKLCFHNAYLLASRSRGRLTYVEGYALGSVIPVHHAWCVDEEGGVVEKTWPFFGAAYLGVPFPLEYVRRTKTPDNCSMIDRWQDGWPLLQTPFDPDTL